MKKELEKKKRFLSFPFNSTKVKIVVLVKIGPICKLKCFFLKVEIYEIRIISKLKKTVLMPLLKFNVIFFATNRSHCFGDKYGNK